ncbi:MAG: GTP-binding protein, partial [Lachnospiraceae bacterium]|nr:GTP-binding protein [Lachnospiraceae bacterium]
HHDDDEDECCCHGEHDHEGHEHHHHDDDEDECCCHGEHDHEDHEHHHEHDHEGHEHHHDHDHDHDGHHHHHHHADDVFTSWGKETPRKYTKEEVEDILKALSDEEICGTVLRAKGMLPAADGTWIHFDFVPEEYEIRTGAADYTGRFCVIGAKLNETKLEELFHLA